MSRLFISHSTQDDSFARELRAALELHGQPGWIDSRELRGGDVLWPTVQKAIADATAYALVVSPASLQSEWVGDELAYALELQKQRGRDDFPVIPISLDGTKLGVLKQLFGGDVAYIPVSSAAGGIDAALDPILAALGKRLRADVTPIPQPPAEPLEELVLELTDLKFHEEDGVRRASARARLLYQPATPGQRQVTSTRWPFVAPLGPIEAEELRWYLEKYAIWPSAYFRDRARRVEENLVRWGRLLHDSAMPVAHTANVMQAWARIDDHAGRRFSVHVDAAVDAGASESDLGVAKEAATALLGLPWELLHDGGGFLFQGAKPTRVRRRLPFTTAVGVPVVDPPIRILLATARPEDDACSYIDHRASALPLVEAMEALPGLVRIHVLNPPTLPALRDELDRARRAREPYHVVHFDGHGVYNRQVGLGGLCFEDPQDVGKLQERRHVTVYTNELGQLLRDHRIPLVFLEACQTAQAEQASESVASSLLQAGVASVVAMSHSVLVETARRFVETFYDSLADGARVGDAMLAGQRNLKDDATRGRIFGVGELRLEDWFVPVLFQEEDDPQLFCTIPSRQTREDFLAGLDARLGELPPEPATGFVGRSRELLALQRLLHDQRYAVVRGQGGEGKTALAAEFARWMVRSHQVGRAAFVSVEMHGHVGAVLDGIGRQLVPGYSVAAFENLERATLPVESALAEQSTILVVDNMESVLLPPFVAAETPDALTEESRRELDEILKLSARLMWKGGTRIVFTSREALPTPFDAPRHQRELHRLDREDAVKLVERVLNESGSDGAGSASDAAREEIELLVDAVHGHARTLALLAPSLRSQGVEATRESLVELMAAMERRFPGSREQSVFASLELSLRRLSPANQERARVLGLFHGAVDLDVLRTMMQWDEIEVEALARELVLTGIATLDPFNHLTLNPALCPYLLGRMVQSEHEALMSRWRDAMSGYVDYLERQRFQAAEIASSLTALELANLFAYLEDIRRTGDAARIIDLTSSLFRLLQGLGRSRLLERVAEVRNAAERELDETWTPARFEAQQTRVEEQLLHGRVHEALADARDLLQRVRAAGEMAYPGADYAEATAVNLLGQVLYQSGDPEGALVLYEDARQRFEKIAATRNSQSAGRMAAVCMGRQGDCLRQLGRLDEAAATYEEVMRFDSKRGAERDVAVDKGQLATVRMMQNRYKEALEAFHEALQTFMRLDEPRSVAVAWHQIGIAYYLTGEPEAAEDAYRKALVIRVRLGDVPAQADTLLQLGNLYYSLNRLEEAVTFYMQAAGKYVENQDRVSEGMVRSNLARVLCDLHRLDEARQEIVRAIESDTQFGDAAEPWKTWMILARIETAAGNAAAAAEAKRKAIVAYLTYRRDGGENHFVDGRIARAVTQALSAGGPQKAMSLLQQITEEAEDTDIVPFLDALRAIVGGSRDRALADNPQLDHTMAAEILFFLERLEGSR